MKKPEKKVEEHHLVYQGNPLIEGIYRITLNAKKTMLYAIAQIQPDDEDFKDYMIDVDDFKKLLGIKGEKNYFKVLVQAVRELRATDITVYDEKTDCDVNIPFAVDAIHDRSDNSLGINFSPRLKPYLLELKETGNFTRYRLGNVMKLRSVYSIRIYELLKQYENTKTKKRTFELGELRKVVGVPDGKLERYYNFKVRVLEPAKKELKAQETDIGFDYKEIKKGRSVKWIEFTIKPRQKAFISDGQGNDIDTADIPLMLDIPQAVIDQIPEQYRTHHDVLRDITAYFERHGEAYVYKNVAYAASKAPKDFAAYLGNTLKNNYGAEYNPNQQSLFPELDDTPVIEPGMVVVYQGKEYKIDEALSIFPESGGCMPGGQIVQGIRDDKIKIKMDE